MIDYWCGRAQPSVGCSTTEQMVLGAIRKQAEQARRSKSESSLPPWLLLQFLSLNPYLCLLRCPSVLEYALTNKPVLSQVAFGISSQGQKDQLLQALRILLCPYKRSGYMVKTQVDKG